MRDRFTAARRWIRSVFAMLVIGGSSGGASEGLLVDRVPEASELLQVGDIILEVDGQPVPAAVGAGRLLFADHLGAACRLTIRRDGADASVSGTIPRGDWRLLAWPTVADRFAATHADHADQALIERGCRGLHLVLAGRDRSADRLITAVHTHLPDDIVIQWAHALLLVRYHSALDQAMILCEGILAKRRVDAEQAGLVGHVQGVQALVAAQRNDVPASLAYLGQIDQAAMEWPFYHDVVGRRFMADAQHRLLALTLLEEAWALDPLSLDLTTLLAECSADAQRRAQCRAWMTRLDESAGAFPSLRSLMDLADEDGRHLDGLVEALRAQPDEPALAVAQAWDAAVQIVERAGRHAEAQRFRLEALQIIPTATRAEAARVGATDLAARSELRRCLYGLWSSRSMPLFGVRPYMVLWRDLERSDMQGAGTAVLRHAAALDAAGERVEAVAYLAAQADQLALPRLAITAWQIATRHGLPHPTGAAVSRQQALFWEEICYSRENWPDSLERCLFFGQIGFEPHHNTVYADYHAVRSNALHMVIQAVHRHQDGDEAEAVACLQRAGRAVAHGKHRQDWIPAYIRGHWCWTIDDWIALLAVEWNTTVGIEPFVASEQPIDKAPSAENGATGF